MRIASILAVLFLTSVAGATVLDFEGPPTGYIAGNEYVPWGVVFGGSAGVQEYNYGFVPPSEIMTSGDWYSPLEISFVLPGNANAPAFTNYAALYNWFGPGNGMETDMLTATSYDLLGNAIETHQIVGDGWLTFNVGNIHKLVVDDMQNTAFTIDFLTFNTPVVPEPAALSALGLGLLGLLGWRRRR